MYEIDTAYDKYGNIKTRNGIAYTYGNSIWKDQLTGYGDKSISYDSQGNPTSYLGHTLTWEKGRQLKKFDSNTYTYNANGIRTGKTVSGVKHSYRLDGTKILSEKWGTNILTPLYDNKEEVCGIVFNGASYYFLKNLQGDVISILDSCGNRIAEYLYDAWGVCTIVNDDTEEGIAAVNPFRYRSYYYDTEIGMYYLQSRYYDPVVGRFVNADDIDYLGYTTGLLSYNLFTYCDNNPLNHSDKEGHAIWSIVAKLLLGVLSQYAGDIIQNIIRGCTGWRVFKPVSSVGTYISAAISSLLKGGKIFKNIAISFINEIIKIIENSIKGKKSSLSEILKNFIKNTIVGILGDFISSIVCSKIMSLTPNNYSTFAHSQYLKNAQITPDQIRTKMVRVIKIGINAAGAFDFLVSAVVSAS